MMEWRGNFFDEEDFDNTKPNGGQGPGLERLECRTRTPTCRRRAAGCSAIRSVAGSSARCSATAASARPQCAMPRCSRSRPAATDRRARVPARPRPDHLARGRCRRTAPPYPGRPAAFRYPASELDGWLFLSAPGAAGGKLMTIDKRGRVVHGQLAANLETEIIAHSIDLVTLDPFVKSHSVEENLNSAIDDVAQVLSDLAAKHDIAIDVPHHISKGVAEPGNANRGRGASSLVNACRLVSTLTPMSADEAKASAFQRTIAGSTFGSTAPRSTSPRPQAPPNGSAWSAFRWTMAPAPIPPATRCRPSNRGSRRKPGPICPAICSTRS